MPLLRSSGLAVALLCSPVLALSAYAQTAPAEPVKLSCQVVGKTYGFGFEDVTHVLANGEIEVRPDNTMENANENDTGLEFHLADKEKLRDAFLVDVIEGKVVLVYFDHQGRVATPEEEAEGLDYWGDRTLINMPLVVRDAIDLSKPDYFMQIEISDHHLGPLPEHGGDPISEIELQCSIAKR